MTIVVIGGISLLELINRGGVLTPGGTTFEGDHLRGERPTIDCDDQDSDDHLLKLGRGQRIRRCLCFNCL